MPYKTFYNWLFDGSRNSSIPKPKVDDDGKVLVPDLLKYNSPISHTFLISMFMKVGPLNHYLDKYFNNISLRYLDKKDLFSFVKKCVLDFKVRRRDITYIPYQKQNRLFSALKEKFPMLKNHDVKVLSQIINSSDEKERIYYSLNLEVPKKKKLKKSKKKITSRKCSLKEFLEENFSIIKMEKPSS
jgi:hypothetical protein